MRTLSLHRFDELAADIRPTDALGALAELELVGNALDTQEAAIKTLGGGLWNLGWTFDSLGPYTYPRWGGGSRWLKDGGPVFRRPGMRPGGYSVGVATGPFLDRLFLQHPDGAPNPGATEDLAWLVAIPGSDTFTNSTYIVIKNDFGGGPGFWLWGNTDGSMGFTVSDGVDNAQATLTAGTKPSGAFVVGGVLERATNKSRFGVCPIGGVAVVTAEQDASAVGSLQNSNDVLLGHGGQAAPLYVAHALCSVGAGAAKGTSAVWATILERYAAAMVAVPAVVDAAAGRGRSFAALSRNALEAADVTPGATLAARDASIQALVKWNPAAQLAAAEYKLGGGHTFWDSYLRSEESYSGDLELEAEVGETMTVNNSAIYAMLGFRRASDATEGLNGFNHFAYISQNALDQLEFFEGGSGTYASGASFLALGDRIRVRRTAGGVFTLWHMRPGATGWTSLFTGGTDAAAMVVAATWATGVYPFRDITLRVDGVRREISLKHATQTHAEIVGTGTIGARGKGTSSAEYTGAGLEVRAVNAAASVGELAWLWQTSTGELRRQVGALFSAPPSGYLLLTATRRWISTTRVVLRYYVGGTLIGEVESTDGDIGGGTTGTTTIGGRYAGRYPLTAEAMKQAAAGFGTWLRGYLFNDANGNAVPVFGAGDLVVTGSPAYAAPGPRYGFDDGVDKAIGINTGDRFDHADTGVANLGASDDLIACVVTTGVYGTGGTFFFPFLKGPGDSTPPLWLLSLSGSPLGATLVMHDGVDSITPAVTLPKGPCVIVVALSRSTNRAAIAAASIGGVELVAAGANAAAIGSMSNANTFRVGHNDRTTNTEIAGVYLGSGSGVALGCPEAIGEIAKSIAKTIGGTYVDFFDGTIDELRVCDYELAPEEVEATWRRLTFDQPQGYQMLRELHPPDFPISADPSSRVQRETNLWGQALGYASAQAENLRANILPDRAYGDILTRWESIVGARPGPNDTIDQRRARVLGRLRARAGVSIPGVAAALEELAGTDPGNLEILGFGQETRDLFSRHEAWNYLPEGSYAASAGTIIEKTGGGGSYNVGAVSLQTIQVDGYIELEVADITQSRYFGLFADATYTINPAVIDYAIAHEVTAYTPYENGVSPIGAVTGLAVGDVLRIERRGTTVRWYRNGAVYYTSSTPSAGALRVSCTFSSVGAIVQKLRFVEIREDGTEWELGTDWTGISSGGSQTVTDATWRPTSTAKLVKNGGSGASYDAGASSVETIEGDGFVEAIPALQFAQWRAFGLSVDDPSVHWNTIDYAMIAAADGLLYAAENGVATGSLGGYALGDVLRVERVGTTVYFKRNGAVIHTAAVTSTGALRIDTSILTASTPIPELRLYDAAIGAYKSITWQNAANVAALSSDHLRVTVASGAQIELTSTAKNWLTARQSLSSIQSSDPNVRIGYGAHMLAQVSPVTMPNRSEMGIAFVDEVTGHATLLGLRITNAGVCQIITERFVAGVSQGVTVEATPSAVTHWLHMWDEPQTDRFLVAWSTSGPGDTAVADSDLSNHNATSAVLYVRSVVDGASTLAGALSCYFDDVRIWTPTGERSLYWYAFRDPDLAGAPDLDAAHAAIQALKQAHTQATLITSKSCVCDDLDSPCDRGPLGGF